MKNSKVARREENGGQVYWKWDLGNLKKMLPRMEKRVERRRTGFRMRDIRGRWNVSGVEFRMWDTQMEWQRRRNSRCETPEWNGGGEEFRVWDTRMEWRRRRNSRCETPGWNELCHASQGGPTACKGERATWHFFREDPTGRWKFRERNGLGGSYGYRGFG